MPQVQMIVEISGGREGIDWPKIGGTVDVPTHEAEDLIKAGLARTVERSEPKVETATAPKATETATKKGLAKASA